MPRQLQLKHISVLCSRDSNSWRKSDHEGLKFLKIARRAATANCQNPISVVSWAVAGTEARIDLATIDLVAFDWALPDLETDFAIAEDTAAARIAPALETAFAADIAPEDNFATVEAWRSALAIAAARDFVLATALRVEGTAVSN